MAEGKIGFGFTLDIILIKGTLISTTSGDVQFSGVSEMLYIHMGGLQHLSLSGCTIYLNTIVIAYTRRSRRITSESLICLGITYNP